MESTQHDVPFNAGPFWGSLVADFMAFHRKHQSNTAGSSPISKNGNSTGGSEVQEEVQGQGGGLAAEVIIFAGELSIPYFLRLSMDFPMAYHHRWSMMLHIVSGLLVHFLDFFQTYNFPDPKFT